MFRHSFPCILERMRYVEIAIWTIVLAGVGLVIYKFIVNPQIIVTPSVEKLSQCPTRWTYDAGTKLCSPDYATSCKPFDPSTITNVQQACNIATTCGTNWSDVCT
jgi:hypothetical protein